MDYKTWDSIDEITVIEAAYLWREKQPDPDPNKPPPTDVYEIYKALISTLENPKECLEYFDIKIYPDDDYRSVRLYRGDLKDWAEDKGFEIPKFLLTPTERRQREDSVKRAYPNRNTIPAKQAALKERIKQIAEKILKKNPDAEVPHLKNNSDYIQARKNSELPKDKWPSNRYLGDRMREVRISMGIKAKRGPQ